MPAQFSSLFLIAILALLVGVVLLLRRKIPEKVRSISMLVSTIAIWIAAYLFKSWLPLNVFKSINYFCLANAATAQLLFAFSYTNRKHWLVPATYAILLVEPILTQVLFWTEASRKILFSPDAMIWDQIHIIYTSQLLVSSVFLLMDTFLNKPRSLFLHAWMIPFGAILPIVGSVLIYTTNNLESHIYIAVFSYSIATACFSYGKFNRGSIERTPLTRDVVVEGMDDGWMVADRRGKVIDVNPAAEKMTGMSRNKIYGLPINQILSDWDTVLQSSDGIKEMEVRRTEKTHQDWQYLNIRIAQLVNKKNLPFGHLIVWRDITERKLADVIHQRARDELFVLLNAISSLASRSMNLEDFLSESSYQIVYSFQSQSIAVYLTEEKDGNKQKLSLKSQFGFSPEHVNMIDNRIIKSGIYNWLNGNEENRPLILDHQHTPTKTPFNPIHIGYRYVALIPLVIYTQHENRVLGCLLLGRNENAPYTQDEVLRLTTIANQIATLIDSNRRRQFAIALSERQRLLRDLHDSVSQKLYGLVALTEAAQAGIEAGSIIAPLEVLSRIGENARQAVKEMRLFLYEMQPVDLKDGLVSSLQHRLAAVEGRADIKARMVSDEDIQLEKDNEIALYYIAMEALNNILRHAQAKNVSVKLKQTRQNVNLEVQDDGHGFDIKKLDNSGLGLRNMKERAMQANGNFKIVSRPKMGTKIIVSVARKGSK